MIVFKEEPTIEVGLMSRTEDNTSVKEIFTGEQARFLATSIIHSFFTTQLNPMVRHHLDSYDQFLQHDIQTIVKANNPVLLLKKPKNIPQLKSAPYKYKLEIYIGGLEGNELFIGTPTLALDGGKDVRLLFPNEARLRNLTYAVQVKCNVHINVYIQPTPEAGEKVLAEPIKHEIKVEQMPLCSFPLMLHSRYCILNGKATTLLQQMGECPYDQGGYFIIDGSEKILMTRQEGAFNTLWITKQPADPKIEYYGSISCLNPKNREVRRVSFYWSRERVSVTPGFKKTVIYNQPTLEVSIPYVLKPIPVFILFRALGYQTDKEILQLIFPDHEHPEAKLLADMLIPSINAAAPFLDTYSAIEYIRLLTKGFSSAHVLDILHTHLFGHIYDYNARGPFLAECVRKMLRVVRGIEAPASRDDTRNQRCLTSGFLCQMLFQNLYKSYLKAVTLTIDKEYSFNESLYSEENFKKLFDPGNQSRMFQYGFLSQGIMKGFKGKWIVGNNQEEVGILQELSRMSYIDFMSHCRRAVLNFDTSMKLTGPRRLNPSQYGYFCTSETPSGSSIGVTKNLTILTTVSLNMNPGSVLQWLVTRGSVLPSEFITPNLASVMVPVYLNSGLVGYTGRPKLLSRVLRAMKRTGCLPPYSSSGFNIPERKLFIYLDEGRTLRPLIICDKGVLPDPHAFYQNGKPKQWRELVVGTLHKDVEVYTQEFRDPFADKPTAKLEEYESYLTPYQGLIEYVDPYEQNEALVSNVPEYVIPNQTTHMEIHPSTILSLIGGSIPFSNHNQSPRNQLGSSQSKQGLSLYCTNWKNRYDNTANILCYGQAPLTRTLYQDYVGGGILPYGENVILAMGMYGGYNQEDGIIMNADALARGQFRSINYRGYETFEEDDPRSHTSTRIAHPKSVPGWMELKSNLDYGKLDDAGIVRPGEYVDQNTVLVAKYMVRPDGKMTDASLTPQVWTRGRVESVVVTVSPAGLKLIKVRVTQDRIPELGDKFSNRHGQKGTLNVLYRGHDMPRTLDGIVPDMIMNPTAIPSRMTIGQILEMLFGVVASEVGSIANGTVFMNDGSPHEMLGDILEKRGFHKLGNQVLYNGMTGEMMEADIYMGVVYGMRLKHMTEDKWNARGEGRKEQRTHQPTGGRGNEGGLKIGEMERDAIVAHGVSSFLQESMMKRSDGTTFTICNGCGTIPLYNERQGFYLCPLCDGPVQYSGETINTLDPIPPPTRSATTFSTVEMPYASKLFFQELETFLNLGLRVLTTADSTRLKGMDRVEEIVQANTEGADLPLPIRTFQEVVVPQIVEPTLPTASEVAEQLAKLNEQAVDTYQQMTELVAQEQSKQTNQAQPQLQFQAPREGEIQLQPQSIAPITAQAQSPLQQDVFANVSTVKPEVDMQTADGAPIIQIDTSDAAMAAEGLKQPKDEIPLMPLGAEVAPQASTKGKSRFAIQKRQPPPQPDIAQDGGFEGGFDDEQPSSSTGPLKVIKMG